MRHVACAFAISMTLSLLAIAEMRAQTSNSLATTQNQSVTATFTENAQALTTLASFNGTNGKNPESPLIQGTDGNFYGTTYYGGAYYSGTVFKITPAGMLTTLHSFDYDDGALLYNAGLVQGADGNFYGTTHEGGTSGYGTVFRITPSGALTTLHNFEGYPSDGAYPEVGLVRDTDGNFYGTTTNGGTSDYGTVFKITPGGALTTLHAFDNTDGAYPIGLVKATNGNFYGITQIGGGTDSCNYGCGTVFKITPGGVLTTLHSFNGNDGSNPEAGLVEATDGNFYGTTLRGANGNCSQGCGTVYKITPAGALTTLHSFEGYPTDGAYPYAGLMQATDGNFYGTTTKGGASGSCTLGCGTIFKITPGGTLTTLHSFERTDGYYPEGALVQATDGMFYGTTASGGTFDDGTVFRVSGPAPIATQFVAVTPCRLADTRQTHSPITGGTWQTFIVPQLGGCNIPAGVTAYSLNVSVVPHGPLGYLTVWPAGRPQPYVATLNSLDGRVKGNAAIVPAGASGAVSVYATNTTDVILDINGYFAPPAQNTLQFYPLPPCRVADTRDHNLPSGLGWPHLGNREVRDLPFLASSCLNGINNARAYSINIAVVPNPSGTRLNYLTVWPSDEDQPYVANVNNPTATVVANAAIVPAAANGNIKVFAYNSTDVIMDINGYFAAPGQNGLSFYAVTPCRSYDSRDNHGQPFRGTRPINVAGSPCAPPQMAGAYVFNATVVPSGVMPYLTLWPDPEDKPYVATLNAYDGYITSNMAIVPNQDGTSDAYAADYTQLILDIAGYFAP